MIGPGTGKGKMKRTNWFYVILVVVFFMLSGCGSDDGEEYFDVNPDIVKYDIQDDKADKFYRYEDPSIYNGIYGFDGVKKKERCDALSMTSFPVEMDVAQAGVDSVTIRWGADEISFERDDWTKKKETLFDVWMYKKYHDGKLFVLALTSAYSKNKQYDLAFFSASRINANFPICSMLYVKGYKWKEEADDAKAASQKKMDDLEKVNIKLNLGLMY
jgi:hypothetical protein